MIGMTSVTFRKEPVESIVALAERAGLGGIEWGGDVHVPPGDAASAAHARALTETAGLRVLSYGSYYRLNEAGDPARRFAPVLESASLLGAPAVRIWAGSVSPSEAAADDWRRAADELAIVCAMAAEENTAVCLEYHRQTLTETAESAVKLITMAASANLKTYWQPNPDISHEENKRALAAVLPWLHTMHVYQWGAGNVRHALEAGRAEWLAYIGLANGACPNHILEFVRDDSPEQLMDDAAALRSFLGL